MYFWLIKNTFLTIYKPDSKTSQFLLNRSTTPHPSQKKHQVRQDFSYKKNIDYHLIHQ